MMDGVTLGAEDGIEDNGLPVPPAAVADAVVLDKGNGAELDGPEYDADDPGSPLPVERGPTVSVRDGVGIDSKGEPEVAGGYPADVVADGVVAKVAVKLPKGTDVGACGLPEAGYGTEVGEPEGIGAVDSKVERALKEEPVPTVAPEGVGIPGGEVPFVKGYGIELLEPLLPLGKAGAVVLEDPSVERGVGDRPVPPALPDGAGIDVAFVRG
jgi:hypothetical protein